MSAALRELTRRIRQSEPCLPRPAKIPPSGPDWIHEIKHDGFRIMARRHNRGVRLITRNGYDFADRFPLAAAAIAKLVSKRLGSPYRSGRADCWLKVKNPAAPAVAREAEEEWN